MNPTTLTYAWPSNRSGSVPAGASRAITSPGTAKLSISSSVQLAVRKGRSVGMVVNFCGVNRIEEERRFKLEFLNPRSLTAGEVRHINTRTG